MIDTPMDDEVHELIRIAHAWDRQYWRDGNPSCRRIAFNARKYARTIRNGEGRSE